MKKFLILPLIASTLAFGLVETDAISRAPGEDENILYYADFENAVVSSTIPPDKVTDFIWAQEYLECKTMIHGGSTMLYTKAANKANDFSSIGGFGTSAHSNLGKLRQGEPYQVDAYIEFGNMDFLEVEAVCGDDKWGAIKIYNDGKVLADAGGNNMTDVSYVDHHLSFKFCYSFNDHEGVNGYITFKAFNSNGGYCYFDNCQIAKTQYFIEGTFDEYPVGEFDCKNDSGLRTIFYGGGVANPKSEIATDGSNKFIKFSYDCTSNEPQETFFFNKMQFMNLNRINILSFDIGTQNAKKLYLVYGGTWATERHQVIIDFEGSTISKEGDRILEATYADNHVTIKFKTGLLDGASKNEAFQFQGIVQGVSGQKVSISIDNTRVSQIAELSSISLNTTAVKKTFDFGDTFTYAGMVITGTNTDGTTVSINPDDCTYTGYDMNADGKQLVTVTYKTFTDTYFIRVNRVLSMLNLDTTNVKKTYGYGEELDLTGLVVSVTYADGGEPVTLEHNALQTNGYAVFAGDFNSRKVGEYDITVIYKQLSKSFKVKVEFSESYNFDGITYESIGGK